MQAKGLIRFFIWVLVAVCVYQLSFTFVASRYETKADEYAAASISSNTPSFDSEVARLNFEDSMSIVKQSLRRRYLDSMSNEEVWNIGLMKHTLKEVQNKRINLGLDLKGGMSVILEVSVAEVIQALSLDNNSPIFMTALENAKKKQLSSDDKFINLFQEAFEEQDENAKLATIFAPIEKFQDKIDWNSSNDEVIEVLEEEVDAAVFNTYNVIRARIDQFGVASPNVSLQRNTGRIIVELAGATDPDRIRRVLQTTAELEFWNTYENSEIINFLARANEVLAAKENLAKESAEEETVEAAEEVVSTDTSAADLLGGLDEVEDTTALADVSSPLFEVLSPAIRTEGGGQFANQGPVVGYAFGRDITRVEGFLAQPEVKSIFPQDLKLLWSAKPVDEVQNIYALYAIRVDNIIDNEAALSGDVITNAQPGYDEYGRPIVTLFMNSQGASSWQKITAEAAAQNPQRCVAVVLDGRVYSAPVVQGEIAGGSSRISGLELEESQDLSKILKTGKLDATAHIIEEEVVGPSLGAASVRAGMMSLAMGLSLVLVFMIFYYNKGGIVSDIAVLFNLVLIVGALASWGAALTLPGMAGIVLTIGMAVDANVIIFERIREELAKGKGVRLALTDGYKNSYSAIIDANLTTLITAIILLGFGLGPVKGFATVLVIGILASLFTAVLVTRILFERISKDESNLSFSNSMTKGLLKNINKDFLGMRKMSYMVSGAIIVIGLGFMLTTNFDMGVDFKGGRRYVVELDKSASVTDVRNALNAEFGEGTLVKTQGGSNRKFQITTAYKVDEQGVQIDDEVQTKLFSGLSGFLGETNIDLFKRYNIEHSMKVESTIADDIRQTAIWATVLGSIFIFLYILLRFRKWQFGIGALAAIVHDILIILSIFSIFKGILPFSLEVDQAFIAALLTIIGYSINDTVVVFDRIREYLGLHPKDDLKTNVNGAINSTLSRTLITSATTLMVVLVLFIFGGEVIRGFSFALMMGILVGTYSSVFIASPITVDLLGKAENK